MGDFLRHAVGWVILVTGAIVTAASLAGLGDDSLSPFPQPSGSLKTTGIYGLVRHPLYTGLLSVQMGIALLTDSLDRLLLTVLLAWFIDQKADKEEEYLTKEFPAEYPTYKVRTCVIQFACVL